MAKNLKQSVKPSFLKTTIRVKKKSSFEQKLFDINIKLKELALQHGLQNMDRSLVKELFSQLDILVNIDTLDEEDALPNEESFMVLLKFIIRTRPNNAPYLGLSDEGNFLASWINKSNEIILEFKPQEEIKWLVSCVFDKKKEVANGTLFSIKRLLDNLSIYKTAGWFNY